MSYHSQDELKRRLINQETLPCMERKYLALNSALFFWLLGLVAWCFDAARPAWIFAALSCTAFIVHFHHTQANSMFKSKKTNETIQYARDDSDSHCEPERQTSRNHVATIVASGVHVEGNIVADGNVDIYGTLKGNIDAKEHQITIMCDGLVEGNILCRELIIDGTVTGHSTSETIEIAENGRVTGTLIYHTLAVQKGGVFSGQAELLPAVPENCFAIEVTHTMQEVQGV